jgi:hypothetical protein
MIFVKSVHITRVCACVCVCVDCSWGGRTPISHFKASDNPGRLHARVLVEELTSFSLDYLPLSIATISLFLHTYLLMPHYVCCCPVQAVHHHIIGKWGGGGWFACDLVFERSVTNILIFPLTQLHVFYLGAGTYFGLEHAIIRPEM